MRYRHGGAARPARSACESRLGAARRGRSSAARSTARTWTGCARLCRTRRCTRRRARPIAARRRRPARTAAPALAAAAAAAVSDAFADVATVSQPSMVERSQTTAARAASRVLETLS